MQKTFLFSSRARVVNSATPLFSLNTIGQCISLVLSHLMRDSSQPTQRAIRKATTNNRNAYALAKMLKQKHRTAKEKQKENERKNKLRIK